MHVLQICDGLEGGGAYRQLGVLVRHLPSDVRCTVVVPAAPSLRGWTRLSGLDGLITTHPVRHSADPRKLLDFRSLLRRVRPDLLHLHLSHSGSLRYIYPVARARRVPVVTTEHYPIEQHGLKGVLRRLTLAATVRTIAPSDYARTFLMSRAGIPGDRIVTIHNGIDPEPFLEAAAADLGELGIAGDAPLICCVAALEPRKGIDHLLDAVPRIVAERPDCRFLVLGTGSLEPSYRSRAPTEVAFQSFRPDIPAVLARADVFVLPTLGDNLPLSIIEAMLAGLPVVSTRVGGIPELLQDGSHGMLVPPGDPKALAGALGTLLGDTDLAHEMGRAARAHALEHFDAATNAGRVANLYRSVIR